MLRMLLLVFVATILGTQANAQNITNDVATKDITVRDDLLDIFKEHDATGSFALWSAPSGKLMVVDVERVKKRFIPASTFKILNSLIALETGAVSSVNEVVPYGGKPQPIKVWERDMSLRQAIRVSNVPVYQEVARRVGLATYKELLKRFEFGNQQTGVDVETFWLKGPLEISAVEYARFLARLATLELPALQGNQKLVHQIMRLETREGITLYGKTGWTHTPDPDIGWFVGWLESGNGIHTFALNMDMKSRSDANKRIAITKAILSALELY